MLALPYYKEEWKDVDKNGVYQVSCFGNPRKLDIKYFKTTGVRRYIPLTKIIENTGKSGYQRYIMSMGRGHRIKIHRLVAEAFVPNPDNKPYVDHIDGNPLNNFYLNLKWVTHKENVNNPNTSWKNEKTQFKKGERLGIEHPRHRVISCYTEDGVKVKTYNTVTSTKNDGYCRSAIQKALKEGIMAYNMYWKYGE